MAMAHYATESIAYMVSGVMDSGHVVSEGLFMTYVMQRREEGVCIWVSQGLRVRYRGVVYRSLAIGGQDGPAKKKVQGCASLRQDQDYLCKADTAISSC